MIVDDMIVVLFFSSGMIVMKTWEMQIGISLDSLLPLLCFIS